jgi:hypothetical protein
VEPADCLQIEINCGYVIGSGVGDERAVFGGAVKDGYTRGGRRKQDWRSDTFPSGRNFLARGESAVLCQREECGEVALGVIVVDDQVMRCRLCERTGSEKSGAQPSQDYSAKAIHGLLLMML